MDECSDDPGLYLPMPLSADRVGELQRDEILALVRDELRAVARRPMQERSADLSLLARTPLAEALGLTVAWLRAQLAALVADEAASRQAAALEEVEVSGLADESRRRWEDLARPVLGTHWYPLPPGFLVADSPPQLLVVTERGPVPVGPLVYPVSVEEHGVIRLRGTDRWGRDVDVGIPITYLSRPAKIEETLREAGAWMDAPRDFAALCWTILEAYDLRVSDPEPSGVDWGELCGMLLQIVRSAGDGSRYLDDAGVKVIAVPVAVVERGLGRKVSVWERRRWAEQGLIRRGSDGRYTPCTRLGPDKGNPRCFRFVAALLYPRPEPVRRAPPPGEASG